VTGGREHALGGALTRMPTRAGKIHILGGAISDPREHGTRTSDIKVAQ
jgi:hypothetical protein